MSVAVGDRDGDAIDLVGVGDPVPAAVVEDVGAELVGEGVRLLRGEAAGVALLLLEAAGVGSRTHRVQFATAMAVAKKLSALEFETAVVLMRMRWVPEKGITYDTSAQVSLWPRAFTRVTL